MPRRVVRGRLGLGARPPLAVRPLGGKGGPVAHLLWAQVCGRGCTACVWGGRPCVGACGVCGLCAALVCWWVRGCASCAVVPWCVVLPPFVCRPGAPPSLSLPCGVVRPMACGCVPFPACAPRWSASLPLLTRYPPSCFLIAAFFTLSSSLCWLALLPSVHFSLPLLRPCVGLGFLICLCPRSLWSFLSCVGTVFQLLHSLLVL